MVRVFRCGVSNAIVEALLIIVSVSVATILASTVLSKLSEFQNRFTAISSESLQGLSERLAYIHATYDSSNECFVVYVKNVGNYPVHAFDRATVLFGGSGSNVNYIPYSSSPSPGCGCWGFKEFGVANGVVDPAETIAIRIYNSTPLDPPYRFKLVTSKGTSISVDFSLT